MGGMLSRQRIEQQLEHFKDGCPWADPGENEIWILALEWVLGDEEHRKAYDGLIGQLDLVAAVRFDADSTARERIMALALSQALERLR
ncbi:MAG: hypothetical protein WBY44_12420 [Bryobacteraceae bacterium]